MSRLRKLAEEAQQVLPGVIAEVEPAVRDLLDVPADPRPLHVLMIGSFATTALVTRLGEDVALLHCLEWFSDREPARVLVAHEDTHAWHRLVLGEDPPGEDLAWTVFSEALALQVSRAVAQDRPEEEYFWFGIPGFDDWLLWCREHRDVLIERFTERLRDDPSGEALDAFFGAGFVEGRWRTGFFVADELARRLQTPPRELVRMSVAEAQQAVRSALGA